jgi:hypothetical protein
MLTATGNRVIKIRRLVLLRPLNFKRGAAMENDEKSFDDKKPGEDELLDFEFDELAKDSGGVDDVEGLDDEGIIELVDVVEKGEIPPSSETEEIERFLDKEESLSDLQTGGAETEQSEDEIGGDSLVDSEVLEPIEDIELDLIEAEDTVAISDVEEEARAGEEDQGLGLDLESALETLESSEDSEAAPEAPSTVVLGDADITGLEESEFLLEETEDRLETPPLESEMQLPDEDLSAIPVQDDGVLEGFVSREEPGLEAAATISEEKMEAIIGRVVGEAVRESVRESVEAVLERVARETMTAVAERLITEAIDTLRESLDSNSE